MGSGSRRLGRTRPNDGVVIPRKRESMAARRMRAGPRSRPICLGEWETAPYPEDEELPLGSETDLLGTAVRARRVEGRDALQANQERIHMQR